MSAAELRLFVQPDETFLELAQRTRYEPIRSGVPALGSLRAAQLLEISGPSGSAKTELLMQVSLALAFALLSNGDHCQLQIAAEQLLPDQVAGQRVSADTAGASGHSSPCVELIRKLTLVLFAANVILLDLDAKFDAHTAVSGLPLPSWSQLTGSAMS